MTKLRKALLFAAFLTLTTFGVALAADTVIISNYEFKFLGATDNGDGTSTWTYAITADGDEGNRNGLSHWTLGLDACLTVVSPPAGVTYSTPTNHPYCSTPGVNCLQGNYPLVEYGPDPTTGVTGIRFGDASNNGSDLNRQNPGTHIFEITLAGADTSLIAPIPVGFKSGLGGFSNFIDGPICPSVTAISLASFDTAGTAGAPVAMLTFLVLATLLTLGTILMRQRQAEPVAIERRA